MRFKKFSISTKILTRQTSEHVLPTRAIKDASGHVLERYCGSRRCYYHSLARPPRVMHCPTSRIRAAAVTSQPDTGDLAYSHRERVSLSTDLGPFFGDRLDFTSGWVKFAPTSKQWPSPSALQCHQNSLQDWGGQKVSCGMIRTQEQNLKIVVEGTFLVRRMQNVDSQKFMQVLAACSVLAHPNAVCLGKAGAPVFDGCSSL